MDNSSYYQLLRKRLEAKNQSLKEKIVSKHKTAFDWATSNTKNVALGAMGSILMLTSPSVNLLPNGDVNAANEQFIDIPEHMFVVSDLKQYLPDEVGPLIPAQEDKLAEVLTGYYGFPVKKEINGIRLLHTYGYIGAEQHLMRYRGDTMDSHFQNPAEEGIYYSSGMAPGRGGFGYFAPSKQELGKKEIDREKYYIAVQTFLAPGIENNRREFINFFKFRKMLIVNPNNGRAVVAVIGDAGPAVWTKKHLGGSPEVMKHLQRVDGKGKGAVLYFFIEDPEDKIPLGPIEPVKNN